jgi:hypothetical protein
MRMAIHEILNAVRCASTNERSELRSRSRAEEEKIKITRTVEILPWSLTFGKSSFFTAPNFSVCLNFGHINAARVRTVILVVQVPLFGMMEIK